MCHHLWQHCTELLGMHATLESQTILYINQSKPLSGSQLHSVTFTLNEQSRLVSKLQAPLNMTCKYSTSYREGKGDTTNRLEIFKRKNIGNNLNTNKYNKMHRGLKLT